jgi:lysozyme
MARRSLCVLVPVLWLVAGCGESDSPGLSAYEEGRVGSVSQADTVCADGPTVTGIDVSKWQGQIDWNAAAGSGIDFAIARVSHGTTYIDEWFDANWQGIAAQGLVRGVYQYYAPDEDPIAQADILVNAVGSLGPMDLPPVLDVETDGGVDPAGIAAGMHLWLDHVEQKLGKRPIIYTGKYFWQDYVDTAEFVDYPLWIPNYSATCPNLPTGAWTDWLMFQYTDSGSTPGVDGNVDTNLFNGSKEDLLAFAASGGAGYGAEFVSQSFPFASEEPLQLVAGSDTKITITLKNTGGKAWDANTRLATTMPRDRASAFAGPEWPGDNRYDAVEGTVAPGETYTFEVTLHAPDEPGLYDEHMGLVQEGVTWFSDAGQGGPPDDQLEGIFEVVADADGSGSTGAGAVGEVNFGWSARFQAQASTSDEGGCSAAPSSRTSGAFAVLSGVLALAALGQRRRRAAA